MESLFLFFFISFGVIACVRLLGWPYLLHLDSLKLNGPVVEFAHNSWRGVLTLVTFNGLAALITLAAINIASRNVYAPMLQRLIPICLLPPLPALFAYLVNRLHLTYWQHDRYAQLIVDQTTQRATYYNDGSQVCFALADVVRIVNYLSRNGRAPWGYYDFQVFELKNGTKILVTCLLYSLLSPRQLFPAAQYETVKRRICWLPDNRITNP